MFYLEGSKYFLSFTSKGLFDTLERNQFLVCSTEQSCHCVNELQILIGYSHELYFNMTLNRVRIR